MDILPRWETVVRTCKGDRMIFLMMMILKVLFVGLWALWGSKNQIEFDTAFGLIDKVASEPAEYEDGRF